MKKLIIDNMYPGAIPVYDCGVDSTPMVCSIKNRKDGNVESKMVKAKKKDSRKYVAMLYKISSKSLLGIANILRGMERDKINMFDVCLCIRGDEIGLIKHNS
jgi:hypothetical protein